MKTRLLLAFWLAGSWAAAATVRVEGERYAKVGGPSKIRLVDRPDASGGKVVSYWEEQGVWIEWEFDVAAAGRCAISLRYACQWPDTRRRIEVDGRVPTKACENVRFASTGAWSEHAMHTVCDERGVALSLPLAAGKHTLRMTNVHSRGLAIDVILIHDTSMKFTDVALAAHEAAPLKRLMLAEPANEAVLTESEMRMGRVRATFGQAGIESLWAADTLFVAATNPGPPGNKPILRRTTHLAVRLQRRGAQWELCVTDGRAFFLAGASARRGEPRLPIRPRAYSDGEILRELVVWRSENESVHPFSTQASIKPSCVWRLGSARTTSSVPLAPAGGSGDADAARPRTLTWVGPGRAAAVKIAPAAWAEKGLEVRVESADQHDTLWSCARDYPGLAAFYEYGRFRADFRWERGTLKHCELLDLRSEERVCLWGALP